MLERAPVRHAWPGSPHHRSLENRLQHRSTSSSPRKPYPRGVRSRATNHATSPAICGITQGCTSDSANYQPLSIAVQLQPQFQTGTISEVVSGVGTRLKADFNYGTDEINIRAPIKLSFDTPPPSPPPMITTPQAIPAALKEASQQTQFPMPSTTASP